MSKKILIVDDEPMIRELFREAFESVGFSVFEAPNGSVAWTQLQEASFDCVLSDIMMPGGGGVDLAKNIHHMTGPKPKVFLVTGFIDNSLKNAKDWGVLNIFDKPLNFKEIIEACSRL